MTARHPLREWRDAQTPRRTLKSVAEACGVVVQHLGSIEVGRRKPSLALALRLAEVTGLSPDAFSAPGRHKTRGTGRKGDVA